MLISDTAILSVLSNAAKMKVQKKCLREHFKVRALEQYMVNTERHLRVFNERLDRCIKEEEGCFPDAKDIVSPFVLDVLGGMYLDTFFLCLSFDRLLIHREPVQY